MSEWGENREQPGPQKNLWEEGVKPRTERTAWFTDREKAVILSSQIEITRRKHQGALENDLISPEEYTKHKKEAELSQKILREFVDGDDPMLHDFLQEKARLYAQAAEFGDPRQQKKLRGEARIADSLMNLNLQIDNQMHKEVTKRVQPAIRKATMEIAEEYMGDLDFLNGKVPSEQELSDTHKQSIEASSPPTHAPTDAEEAKYQEVLAEIEQFDGKLVKDILAASEGHTIVHTDMPPHDNRMLIVNGEEASDVRGGFQTLGDYPSNDGLKRIEEIQLKTGILISRKQGKPEGPESVAFAKSMRPVYEVVEKEESSLFGFKKRKYEEKRRVRDVENTMKNPLTGKEEPAVMFNYRFDSQKGDEFRSGELDYSTLSDRPGNILNVLIELPESIAEKLKEEIQRDPKVAREIAKQITVSKRTGITEDDWSKKQPGKDFRVSPPYEKLPSDWKITMFDYDKEELREL